MLRRLLGWALVVSSAMVLPSGAHPALAASNARLPALAGTTIVSGADSYSLPVFLPRPARASIFHMSTSGGGGRFYGFVLRKDGPDVTPFAFDVNEGFCVSPGCRPLDGVPRGVLCVCGVGRTGLDATLPAGRYHLYLIADGVRVTARFSLGGLDGTARFDRGTALPTVIDQPAPSTALPASTFNYYSAGVRRSVGPRGGFVFDVTWKLLVSPVKSENIAGICNTLDAASDNPAGAYQYPCDTQSPGGFWVGGQLPTSRTAGPLNLVPEGLSTFSMAGYIDPARQYLGAFNDGEMPATEAHTQILWMQFAA